MKSMGIEKSRSTLKVNEMGSRVGALVSHSLLI